MSDVTIQSETQCQLGEGPFFCERRNTLFWFDIVEKKRYAHDFATGKESVLDLPEMASAMAVIDDNRDLIFTERGLWIHDIATGDLSLCMSVEADNPVTRSNDARVHPSGAFWLGTMGKTAEAGAGAIYHFRQGEVTTLYADITIPNAICFSPDGTQAFFTDTPTAKLMRVATDPQTGLPIGEPDLFYDHTGGQGGLDGAITDAAGMIWNARWGASALDVYDPKVGRIATHPMPMSQPSCPAFVGGGRIAVTSAWQGMNEAQKAADPHAGKTVLVDAGVSPKFEPRVLV